MTQFPIGIAGLNHQALSVALSAAAMDTVVASSGAVFAARAEAPLSGESGPTS